MVVEPLVSPDRVEPDMVPVPASLVIVQVEAGLVVAETVVLVVPALSDALLAGVVDVNVGVAALMWNWTLTAVPSGELG